MPAAVLGTDSAQRSAGYAHSLAPRPADVRISRYYSCSPYREPEVPFGLGLQDLLRDGATISRPNDRCRLAAKWHAQTPPSEDRKSTRLNSSHANISYAVFCLKKKKKHA